MAEQTLDELAGWADRKATELRNADHTEALKEIAGQMYQSVFESFAQARDPDGRTWKPLEDSPRRPLLGRKGQMIARVLRAHRAARVERIRITVDVPSEIAPLHDLGRRKRPQRTFLGFGQDDLERAADTIAKHAVAKLVRT